MDGLAPAPSRRPRAGTAGRRGPLFWLALGSIGLNLFLIGGLIGISGHWPGRHPPPSGQEHMIEQMASILPAPDAAILRTSFASRHDRFEAAQKDLHGAMDRVRTVAAATPLDPDALRAAIEEASRKRMAIGTIVGETMVEAITRMSPEGRVLVTRRPPDAPPRD
jgi:uncharacterized membrane protein